MEEKSVNSDFNNKDKSILPENFFEKFQNRLSDSIDGFEIPEYLDESALDFLIKAERPQLPAGYFEQSKSAIINRIHNEKVIAFKPKRLLFATASIAAILIIGLLVVPFLGNNNVDPGGGEVTIPIAEETNTEEDEMDEYLAFIDESTLYDFYLEEESEEEVEEDFVEGEYGHEDEEDTEEEEDAILDYVGGDFEDIYFDL